MFIRLICLASIALFAEQTVARQIQFSFENKPIIEIIGQLQKEIDTNVLLPQGINAIPATQTVTFKPADGNSLELAEAWKLLITFLDLAGYTLTQTSLGYVIQKKELFKVSDITPIYITPLASLPFSQERIKYVHFLSNLQLKDESVKTNIVTILKEILSAESTVIVEAQTNALIISDRSDLISNSMHIIQELDKSGFKEVIEVVPLYYTAANDVKNIFDQLVLAASDTTMPINLNAHISQASTYFANGTVIMAYPETNALILMGKHNAIERIKEFVASEIDTPPQQGKSIVHVVDLQYLNAQLFAPTLNDIVSRHIIANQSRADGEGKDIQIRSFNPVIIFAEPEVITKQEIRDIQAGRKVDNAVNLLETAYSAGNRLIIAALEEDWIAIKQLIQQLDRPEKQVLIEAMILDIRENKDKIIAGANRNFLNCGIDNGVDYLASHISGVSTLVPTTANTLAVDLLGQESNVERPNVVDTLGAGSTLISFNESCVGIWGLLQVLDSLLDINVVSRPHLVVLNNETGKTRVSVIRRVLGASYLSEGMPITPFEDLRADILLEVKPQINSLNQVILEIFLDISEFISPLNVFNESSDNRINRALRTQAKLNNGQLLALGGLSRSILLESLTETPIISQIPFIGSFFKRERYSPTRLSLALFIIPTVIEPHYKRLQDVHTHMHLEEMRQDALDDNLFENRKDPITRFFLTPMHDPNTDINEYLSRTNNIMPRNIGSEIVDDFAHEKAAAIKHLLLQEENPLLDHQILKPQMLSGTFIQ